MWNSLSGYSQFYMRAINLYPVKIKTLAGNKWGFINNRGNFAISPNFDYAEDFQDNGLAVVSVNNSFGIINTIGNFVVLPKYNYINEYSEGRAVASYNGEYKLIDENGSILNTKKYDYVGNFKNGRAIASAFDEKGKYLYGYLDRDGKEVIPLKYESASDFVEGKAVVKIKDEDYALIGPNGEVFNSYKYYFVGSLGEGLLVFQEKMDGKFGYIDEKGRVIIKPQFNMAQPFSQGRAIVNTRSDSIVSKCGLIDKAGNYKIKPEYNDIILLGENRAAVGIAIKKENPCIGSLYAIADTKGDFLTNFIYLGVSSYNNRLASAYDSKNTFFIDKRGSLVRSLPIVRGNGSLAFIGKLIRAIVDNRFIYFDMNGRIFYRQNIIIPLNYMYRVREEEYKPNKNYIIYYPQVEGMKNSVLENSVNERLKQLSQVKPVDPNAQLDYSYGRDFSIEFFKKKLLVLELDGYRYPLCAAHGMPIKIYSHIDLVTGRFYELKDLFKVSSNYVQILSDIIGEQIKKAQHLYVFSGSYKGIKKDQPFYVDENALYIYFEPYEIAPYAAGFPTFKIPYREISNIINVRGEFWRAFN